MVKTDERVTCSEESSVFDLATYLKQQKSLIEEALDRSLPIGKPEKTEEKK